jgi:hypothetical protein
MNILVPVWHRNYWIKAMKMSTPSKEAGGSGNGANIRLRKNNLSPAIHIIQP